MLYWPTEQGAPRNVEDSFRSIIECPKCGGTLYVGEPRSYRECVRCGAWMKVLWLDDSLGK